MRVSLLIGDRDVASSNGGVFERPDPLSGEVATVASAATLDDADAAVSAASSVFSTWSAVGPGERRLIEPGICHINGPTVHDEARMPFGGVKGSGYGRFGGHAGIAEFTELRWITVETRPQHYPF